MPEPVPTPVKRGKRITLMFNEQGGDCAYCGEGMTLDLGYKTTAEVDHVVPLSKGGERFHTNEVAVCHGCNQDKANTKFVVWLMEREP
jgi:5-methylcytosine-specific restriction endonuclease McrA